MSRTNVYSSSYVSCYRYRFYTLYKFHNNLPLNCGIASLKVKERVLIMIVADMRTACNLEKHSQGTETMTGSVKQEVRLFASVVLLKLGGWKWEDLDFLQGRLAGYYSQGRMWCYLMGVAKSQYAIVTQPISSSLR